MIQALLILEAIIHHLNNHKGIFVDIFPLDNVPENNLGLKIRAIFALSITDWDVTLSAVGRTPSEPTVALSIVAVSITA